MMSPHHQEVVGELGVPDYIQLVPQPVYRFLGGVGVAPPESFFADLRQVVVGVHAARRLVARQVGLAELQGHVAHIGDDAGVGHGRAAQVGRQVEEQVFHLLRALDVVRVVLHPQPLFVAGGGVGLDADVDVLKARLVLVHVVGVVGGYQRQLRIFVQPEQPFVNLL